MAAGAFAGAFSGVFAAVFTGTFAGAFTEAFTGAGGGGLGFEAFFSGGATGIFFIAVSFETGALALLWGTETFFSMGAFFFVEAACLPTFFSGRLFGAVVLFFAAGWGFAGVLVLVAMIDSMPVD